ncbi:hypothetical protein Tco_1060691 [Tanacetum coccineum]
MDLFNLIRAPNPTKVKIGTRPRAAHEVPLLTVTASRVIEMEEPAAATESSGTPSTIERSPLDFANENPSQQITRDDGTEDQVQGIVASEVPPPENVTTAGVAPKIDLGEEVAAMGPCSTARGKSLASVGLETGSTFLVPAPQEILANGSNPNQLSYANPQSLRGGAIVGDLESENTSFTSMAGSPGNIYQPWWGVTNNYCLDTLEACQDLVYHLALPGYFSELRHLPNDDFLGQYNINLARQVAMGSHLWLRFEQEAKLLKKSVTQVARRDKRIQARENEIKNLEALLEAEADMKKSAEAKNAELVKELESLYAQFTDLQVNNDRLSQQVVEKRCVEMDARLDALSIDFDEELYPHMLTAIAGRRWVIGHGLRLAVMKCVESAKLRQAFADMVSAGITKGMSEGLKHGVEHRKASLDLELESLKDAPIDIHVYPEVREPKNPWSFKEEILLEDVMAANLSCAEKKKKCQVVCHTHRVGSAHHARADGVPVSVPTVAPQGLAILLADAATQTETSEDEASPRLFRFKSLPPMYNLDWP